MAFAKHSIHTFLFRTSLIPLGLMVGVINASWLGPEGVGIVAFCSSSKNFAFRFGNLGFGSAFAFYRAQNEISTHRLLSTTWSIGCVMSVLCGIIILPVWRRGFSPWNDTRPSIFYLGFPTIPMAFCNNYLNRLLSGELRITAMTIANLITGLFRKNSNG